jgi:hypothetical protein
LPAQHPLRNIIVHRQTLVGEKSPERFLLVARVDDCPVKRRFIERLLGMLRTPREEFVDDRPGLLSAHPSALRRRRPVDTALDHEQSLNMPEWFTD